MGARLRHRRGRRVGRIPYLLCVGGWTHATIVTDPHRGALEQDRCEAEIAALKAKGLPRPRLRARGNGRQNRGGATCGASNSQNLYAPAVVRARDAVLENAARLDATAYSPRAGPGPAQMPPRTRKAPTAASAVRAPSSAHPAGGHYCRHLKNYPQ